MVVDPIGEQHPRAVVDTIRVADRTQAALRFAFEQARKFGHAEVAPEHILLGILDDGGGRVGAGVATTVLANLGLDRAAAVRELDALLAGMENSLESGAKSRYSSAARAILDAASAEVRALGHSWLGSEHLLLAVLQVESPAAELLKSAGISLVAARSEVVRLLGPST